MPTLASGSLNPFTLHGQRIVLTGGAGLYGRGVTRALSGAGATVILASRNGPALERVVAEDRAAGLDVHARALDLGSEDSILRLRDTVLADFGRIDGLVNNAVARTMTSVDSPLADWTASMEVNAGGLFAITRAFGAVMVAQGSGAIVNVGSIQGMVGPHLPMYEGTAIQTLPDYFFHKAGMINLTRYFAALYGPHGVRVNCVSPGGYYNGQDAEFVSRYANMTYLRRMADDEDLGGPIVFLLSPAAKYVTAANLPVDGGYTAH